MDFSWTAQQEELHRAALELARGRLATNGAADGFDRAAWRACAEFGVLGLPVPERYGGLGLDLLTSARVLEALGEGCEDTGLLFSACAHVFACCVPLADRAAPPVKERLLPRLASGAAVGANAITEAEAGSDVLALRTSAARDGDRYRLNGVKTYVTNGPVADTFVVYACTDPGAGYLGLSAFVVERDAAGLECGQPFAKTGLSGSPVASLYLDECEVPVDQRLGAEGQGALIFKASMLAERACLFAVYLGVMERELGRCVDYARTRRQFGRPIGKNQAISHRIADMKLRLDGARLLLYRACWQLDRGEDATLAASLAKVAVSEAAVQSGLDAVRIHGGLGVMAETGIDRGLRDALPATIFSGTSEMQRDLIAGRLGL
jgi:L-prolyl-PCP dehydrogenase